MLDPHNKMLPAYKVLLEGNIDPAVTRASLIPDPVAIGAVGGSGTRVMEQMVTEAGLVPASPLNRAGDAMEWPPFKVLLADDMLARFSRQSIIANTLAALESLLVARRERLGQDGRSNWKVPGTFFWLRELSDYFPDMQYIHLIRHGLDMAYSSNHNQISNWASRLGIEVEYGPDGKARPGSMLEYWLAANEHAIALGTEHLGERLLLVRFEELCAEPLSQLTDILTFLGLDLPEERRKEIAALVRTPGSIGRYKGCNWQEEFSPRQLERLENLGYKP